MSRIAIESLEPRLTFSLTMEASINYAEINPYDMQTLGNKIVFSHSDNRATATNSLWVTDGTGKNTFVLDSSHFSYLIGTVGQYAFFASGDAIWRTDGTRAGTIRLSSMLALDNGERPKIFKNRVFFFRNSTQFWSTDGTVAGTQLCADMAADPNFGTPRSIIATSTAVYAISPYPTDGYALYRTTSASVPLKKFATLSTPDIVAAGDNLLQYFPWSNGNYWKRLNDNGTFTALDQVLADMRGAVGIGNTIYILASLNTGPAILKIVGNHVTALTSADSGLSDGYTNSLTLFGNKLVVIANEKPFLFDPADSSLRVIRNGTTDITFAQTADVVGGKLVLTSIDYDRKVAPTIYLSDGTSAGTHVLTTFPAYRNVAEHHSVAQLGSTLYFPKLSPTNEVELGSSNLDGSGQKIVYELQTPDMPIKVKVVAAYGSTRYLAFEREWDDSNTWLISYWKQVGSDAPVLIHPGYGTADLTAVAVMNGYQVLLAGYPFYELMTLDSNDQLISTEDNLYRGGDPVRTFSLGDVLLVESDGALYRFKGNPPSLQKLDLGERAPSLADAVYYRGYVYFKTTTPRHIVEFWRTDGSPIGTEKLDLSSVTPPSSKGYVTYAGFDIIDGKLSVVAIYHRSETKLYSSPVRIINVDLRTMVPNVVLAPATITAANRMGIVGNSWILNTGLAEQGIVCVSAATGAAVTLASGSSYTALWRLLTNPGMICLQYRAGDQTAIVTQDTYWYNHKQYLGFATDGTVKGTLFFPANTQISGAGVFQSKFYYSKVDAPVLYRLENKSSLPVVTIPKKSGIPDAPVLSNFVAAKDRLLFSSQWGTKLSTIYGFKPEPNLAGRVFFDPNRDGVVGSTETGLAGWKVFFDSNKNGILNSAERYAVTDANGFYIFSDVPVGDVLLRIVPPTGYTTTTANPAHFTVAVGKTYEKNFGLA